MDAEFPSPLPHSIGATGKGPFRAMLKKPYQESAQGAAHAVQPGWVRHDLRAVEGWAEHRGMADFAAQPASDAAIVDMRDGIGSQGIGAGLYRQ